MFLNELQTLWTDLQSHKWLAVAVIVIGYVTRLLSSDTRFPITIPNRWKPLVVLGLSAVYSILTMVLGGFTWVHATEQWLLVAAFSMGAFDVIVKAVWNGDEPRWLKWIVTAFPEVELWIGHSSSLLAS